MCCGRRKCGRGRGRERRCACSHRDRHVALSPAGQASFERCAYCSTDFQGCLNGCLDYPDPGPMPQVGNYNDVTEYSLALYNWRYEARNVCNDTCEWGAGAWGRGSRKAVQMRGRDVRFHTTPPAAPAERACPAALAPPCRQMHRWKLLPRRCLGCRDCGVLHWDSRQAWVPCRCLKTASRRRPRCLGSLRARRPLHVPCCPPVSPFHAALHSL